MLVPRHIFDDLTYLLAEDELFSAGSQHYSFRRNRTLFRATLGTDTRVLRINTVIFQQARGAIRKMMLRCRMGV